MAREKDKIFLGSNPATSDLTGTQCSPNTIQWTYDTWMLARSTGGAMVKAGGDTWFFLTADYAFGHALERDTANFVKAQGGKVLGQVRTPFPGNTDFSAFLLQAQASRAKVIGLANAGGDTITTIKQAAEFGITRGGTKLAALLMFISDVHALGLKTASGLVCSATFYWDLNDRTRAFTKRVLPDMPSNLRPGMGQAGCYSAALHYLKTVADMGAAKAKESGAKTVQRMKAIPTDDDVFGKGRIREDGRKLHPAYLFEVKTPRRARAPGTTTSCCRPPRPTRHSGLSPRATARWCAARDRTQSSTARPPPVAPGERKTPMPITRRALVAAAGIASRPRNPRPASGGRRPRTPSG